MVRLEVAELLNHILPKSFQFQYGAIRGSCTVFATSKLPYFNSSMVRLEGHFLFCRTSLSATICSYAQGMPHRPSRTKALLDFRFQAKKFNKSLGLLIRTGHAARPLANPSTVSVFFGKLGFQLLIHWRHAHGPL